jgi:anti-sigma regulatory factor (Ser/Thr protein kinase)
MLDEIAGTLPRRVLDDLRVVTSELVANAVKFAGETGSSEIELRIIPLMTCIRVEVIDHGPGFYPQMPPPSPRDTGYGLYLVDKLTTRWGVEFDGGARVWAEVPLPLPRARTA